MSAPFQFNNHQKLQGAHAFLSASKSSWVNYDEDKLVDSYTAAQAAALGTRLHALAAEHIALGLKMPRTSATLNQYINDAIGYRMTPEQVLFYSENAFGTADAIRFDVSTRRLRIHDLKTGITKVNVRQLEVYMSLFCLEYNFKPYDIEAELRVYQNDDVVVHVPDPNDILYIMDKIVSFDKLINHMKGES